MQSRTKLDKSKVEWFVNAIKGGATNYILAQELKVSKEQVIQWKKLYL